MSAGRPVDGLRQLMIECGGPEAEAVRGYFGLQVEQQTGVAWYRYLVRATSRLVASVLLRIFIVAADVSDSHKI